jgi:hypothetical protein
MHEAYFVMALNLSRKVSVLIQAVLETNQLRTETDQLKIVRDLNEYIKNQRWLLTLQLQL